MFRRQKNMSERISDGKNKFSGAVEALPLYAAQRVGDLRSQLAEVAAQLQELGGWRRRKRSHKLRNSVIVFTSVLTGVAAVVAAPRLRKALDTRRRGSQLSSDPVGSSEPKRTGFEEQIVVAVPVSTAYNQWTQFEEFPKFMDGVDEVRQIDDTLLHWAATVAGKKAEWDAKITEQAPDRRIAWESVDGKHNRGTVTFEPAGASQTLIRLDMSYTAEGAAEKVGAAVGLDSRQARGDLERFRDLIEGRQSKSGAWRGEISNGETQEITSEKSTKTTNTKSETTDSSSP